VIFTVFTATFNRGEKLERVFRTLQQQTFKDFEWVIVDDGSTDDTRERVEDWIGRADFTIRYIYQPNGGKHRAYNRAVAEARGELFLTHDSDDICHSKALEMLHALWLDIPEIDREKFSGVTVLCQYSNGTIIGDRFSHHVVDSDELPVDRRLAGDKWGFHRTDVMREFPFPTFSGEKFIPEGVVWNRIATKYRMRCANEVLMTCEYLSDGMSAKSLKLRQENPNGTLLCYSELLKYSRRFSVRMRAAVNLVRFSLHARANPLPLSDRVSSTVLVVGALLPGLLLFAKGRLFTTG